MRFSELADVPVIDIAPLVNRATGHAKVAEQVGRACSECGFFYVVGHGVEESLCQNLETLSRRFFSQNEPEKMRIAMSKGGRAWRGYFPVDGELTSGKPDLKEGLYFGKEITADHPAVLAGQPLHGPNLFPEIPGFRETVLRYIDSLTSLGHALVSAISLGLGLQEDYFEKRYVADPLVLFRIFNYPPAAEIGNKQWGVGEHTDYGLLTILLQDGTGGLQVKSRSGWIDAPPIPGSFVCNIGDMLDRLTRGIYRSTPHRVVNTSKQNRLSFPFFFDPNLDASISPIENLEQRAPDDARERWDRASVHDFREPTAITCSPKSQRCFRNCASRYCSETHRRKYAGNTLDRRSDHTLLYQHSIDGSIKQYFCASAYLPTSTLLLPLSLPVVRSLFSIPRSQTMKRLPAVVSFVLGLFPLSAAGQFCSPACGPAVPSVQQNYHQSAADAVMLSIYREMLRREADGSPQDAEIAMRHEAEDREREMLKKASRFTELWDALFQELGVQGTFNMKTARELSKSFRELEKVGAWPKVDRR